MSLPVRSARLPRMQTGRVAECCRSVPVRAPWRRVRRTSGARTPATVRHRDPIRSMPRESGPPCADGPSGARVRASTREAGRNLPAAPRRRGPPGPARPRSRAGRSPGCRARRSESSRGFRSTSGCPAGSRRRRSAAGCRDSLPSPRSTPRARPSPRASPRRAAFRARNAA